MTPSTNENNVFAMDAIADASENESFSLFRYFKNLPRVTIGVVVIRIIAYLGIIASNVYFTNATEFSYGVLSFVFVLEPVLMIFTSAVAIYAISWSDIVAFKFAFYSVLVSVVTSLENLLLAAVLSNGLLSEYASEGYTRASVICIAILYGVVMVASIILLLLFKVYYDHINIQRILKSPNSANRNLINQVEDLV